MPTTKLVYDVTEVRSNLSKIENLVTQGLIIKLTDHDTHAPTYMVNQKIIERLLNNLDVRTTIEFDNDLKIYTAYNEIIPQIYGEGNTEIESINQMVAEANSFSEEYIDNIDLFSGIFDGIQQFFMGNILLNLEDDTRLREILKIL